MPNTLKVNFKGVEPASGRRTDHVPPDMYQLRVSEVSKAGNKSKNGKLMPVVNFTINRGPQKGKKLMENFVVESDGDETPFGLSRLLALLEACGLKVPRRLVSLDMDQLLDRTCYGDVYDDEYNGRPQSKIGGFFRKPPAQGKPAADDDDEEEDDEEAEDDEDSDDDEEEEDEEEEEEPAPKKKAKAAAAPAAAKKKAAAPKATAKAKPKRKAAADDDDEDDEEDEDEDFDFE